MKKIEVRGARTHNLKNINISLPRDKFIVITGVSGSGKSSLAFDTLYAEGQRRYVESLSAYARQFLDQMDKPDVDHIEGLSPAISIEQKATSHNPRSTVGTITEIYDYLRLLFARVGEPYCPEHNTLLKAQTISQMVDRVMQFPTGKQLMLLAPVVQNRKGEHIKLLENLMTQGYVRARINGEIYDLSEPPLLELHKKHNIEVVIDRFKVRDDLPERLAQSFETAIELSGSSAIIVDLENSDADELVFSAKFACVHCGYSLTELEPRLFSFNNPAGNCHTCEGLGIEQFFDASKVVQNAEISLKRGAIKGWDQRNFYYFGVLQDLARHYDFSLDTPFKDLPEKIQKIILYGTKDKIAFIKITAKGEKIEKLQSFEGVLATFERRYRETTQLAVRDELSKYLNKRICNSCGGSRLNLAARNVKINDINLPYLVNLPIGELLEFFKGLKLSDNRAEIAEKILKEICDRLQFLVNVGLNYLSLSRSAETLSGGEAQRIRLASQIGSGLVGVMYVLDEPSIGLHQRDNELLLKTLMYLRDLGNTVIVVEHDEDAILAADHIVDIGPGAGVHGGEVVAQGSVADIKKSKRSLTGQFLSKKQQIEIPKNRYKFDKLKLLEIKGARGNNLKNVHLQIPVGLFTCVTGVSGSGKSTLINDTLYPLAQNQLNKAQNSDIEPFDEIKGLEFFDKVINIDQSPIGRTPRSNPATYTGLFTPIRELFAGTEMARARGYSVGRFSFNVKGGRCEACEGDGVKKVEMHFLPDVYVVCDQCKGKRYNRETLEILYKGKNIYQILEMTVAEALEFFAVIPSVARKLQTLIDVGLSYIKLGQSSTTLSGGESQRVKLSSELAKRDTGKTLYILDEPTTGLHFADIKQLLAVLHRLREQGNTVVVIEHNLDVIKTADWLVDLGYEGGAKGGEIIAVGTPEELSKNEKSHTGRFLKIVLEK